MRKLTLGLIAVSAAMGLAATPPLAAKDRKSGEEKLAELIEGRTAGEPSRCIRMRLSDSVTIIDKTAIIYRDGDTIWVNRTKHPESLDDDDILVIRKFSGRNLCRLDQITTADRTVGFYTGNVFLTDFVPYKKEG